MKKLLFAFFATAFVLFGCNPGENKTTEQSTTTKMSEKNLASARAVAEAFRTGNTASIDSAVAADFLDHTDKGDVKGRDSLKAMINMMHKTPNDMKMEAIREVADDEYVFQWMHYTGTSDGSMGPKGPYDMHIIEVSKYKDGMVIEHWAYVDGNEMMKMMSAMQKTAAPMADSAKAKK